MHFVFISHFSLFFDYKTIYGLQLFHLHLSLLIYTLAFYAVLQAKSVMLLLAVVQ